MRSRDIGNPAPTPTTTEPTYTPLLAPREIMQTFRWTDVWFEHDDDGRERVGYKRTPTAPPEHTVWFPNRESLLWFFEGARSGMFAEQEHAAREDRYGWETSRVARHMRRTAT